MFCVFKGHKDLNAGLFVQDLALFTKAKTTIHQN